MPRELVAQFDRGNLERIERLAVNSTEAGFVGPDFVVKLPLDGFRVADDVRWRFGVDLRLPFSAPLKGFDSRLFGIPGIRFSKTS